jgi:arginase
MADKALPDLAGKSLPDMADKALPDMADLPARRVALLAAPTNLGLRPPRPGSEPGCAKAPAALRAAGLYRRLAELGAADAGAVLPGPYADDAAPGRLRNQDAIIEHARRLAARISALRREGRVPLVLGGDCGLLAGAGLALRAEGAFGLVHVDGHTDFRHPGNSARCASLAGEDLAAAVGLHWPAISDIDGLAPYFQPANVVHLGCRDDDEYLAEARRRLGAVVPAATAIRQGTAVTTWQVQRVVRQDGLSGYWLHVDVDVLDPSVMPAVDSPDPGGLSAEQLAALLDTLAPGAAGAQVTVFDPELDPDGRYARLLTDVIVAGLGRLGSDDGSAPGGTGTTGPFGLI